MIRINRTVFTYYLLTLFTACVYSIGANVHAAERPGIVPLSPILDASFRPEDNGLVRASDRIVVKAAAGVGKESVRTIDPRITAVTELYRLDSGCYYSVTFSPPDDFEEVFKRFKASPLITSAHPDLLQINEKSLTKGTDRKGFDYIHALGIDRIWNKTKGRGVKIAIIDDGFALDHEDLKGVTLAFGYDLDSKTMDPAPRAEIDTHGTEVAGIIFARHNGIGTDGIAPEAELIAIRHPNTWTSQTILSFNLARLAGADIINCSWTSRVLLEPVSDIINDLATKGRNGKGVALVFAAGNKGRLIDEYRNEASLPGVISVGSIDRNGDRLNFSNFGENVTFYTYGSDILTTGSRPGKYVMVSGTSSSAAIVSGLIALCLSDNPDLTLTSVREKISSIFSKKESNVTE